MCRYPSSSAQRTASTHARAFGICQTPSPSSGISVPSASTRLVPASVTTVFAILISSRPPISGRVHVGGEPAVVLEEEAVRRPELIVGGCHDVLLSARASVGGCGPDRFGRLLDQAGDLG